MQILKLRAMTEGVAVEEGALAALSEVGARTTLRYAAQLLTPAALAARVEGRSAIHAQDVHETSLLFLDAKSSAKILSKEKDKFML